MSWTLKDELSTELNLDPVPRKSASKINPAAPGRGSRPQTGFPQAPARRTDKASAPAGPGSPGCPWRPGQASVHNLPLAPHPHRPAARSPPDTSSLLLELPWSPPPPPQPQGNLHLLSPRIKITVIAFRLHPSFAKRFTDFEKRMQSTGQGQSLINLSSAAGYVVTLGWLFNFSHLSFRICKVGQQGCCGGK